MRSFRAVAVSGLLLLAQSITSAQNKNVELSAFGDLMMSEINSKKFAESSFCTAYGNKSFIESCIAGLPWDFLRQGSSKVSTVLQIDNSHGFVTLQFQTSNGAFYTQAFSVLREMGSWKFDLDNKMVWRRFARKWSSIPYKYGTLRFAQKPSEVIINAVKKLIEGDQEYIATQFHTHTKNNLDFYFLNDLSTAAIIGLRWSAGTMLSGGARNGLMLFQGVVSNREDSIFLHELIHEYTVYDSQWVGSAHSFTNSLLSEGLATWYQMSHLQEDVAKMPPQLRGQVKKMFEDSLCLDKNFLASQNTFSLLDNNLFRRFDSFGYHPAYFLGAGLIDFFLSQMSITTFRDKIWIPVAEAYESKSLAEILYQFGSPAVINTHIQEYISEFQKTSEEFQQPWH